MAPDVRVVRPSGGEEDVMQGRQRWQPWVLPWLVLGLAVPAWAQGDRGGEDGQPQAAVRVQVTQNLTIAVCGDTCDCGTATLVSKESGTCSVQSSTGSCSVDSGQCCVCVAVNTVAVCDDITCECSTSSLLTRVPGPCEVTSSAGSCRVGSGQCCVCAPD